MLILSSRGTRVSEEYPEYKDRNLLPILFSNQAMTRPAEHRLLREFKLQQRLLHSLVAKDDSQGFSDNSCRAPRRLDVGCGMAAISDWLSIGGRSRKFLVLQM